MDPKELRDAYITDVFVESPARLLLHLKDGRAVALTASKPEAPDGAWGSDYGPPLRAEVVNR